MESFNFGAFDTNLGARIAAIPQEAQKQQTANMLQAMQMQGVMNQNELAQSQMRTAKRAEEGQTLLGKAYGGLDFSGAGDGGVPGQSPFAAMKSQVIKSLTASNRPDLIPGELAKLTEMEHKANVNEELIGKINQQRTVAQNSESKRYKDALVNVTNYDSAAYWLRHQYDNPVLKNIVGIVPFETALAEIPKDFVGLEDWKKKNALGIDEYIKQNKPSITTRTTGTITELLSTPGLGGAATVVPGSQATMQMTPGQVQTALDAKLSREQIQRNFNNPALSIQQTPTGLVGVNSRTGIATPVVYGQQDTPGISMTRQPPQNATQGQSIPVTSGAVPVGSPGTQVMGIQTGLKPIPANINLAILANNSSIKNIDETINAIKENPEATGLKSYLPSQILNRAYPEGIEARAGVADIGSIILHDRSGAAVTASESPRLVPFIPLPTDDKNTVIRKLTRLRNIVEQDQSGLTETYSKDQGYLPNPTVERTDAKRLNAPSPSAPPIQSFRKKP
jgi:hypothetical protein